MPDRQSRWNLSRDEEQLAKELVSNQIHVNELPNLVPNEARRELIKRWAYCIHLSLQSAVLSNSTPPPEGRAHQLAAEIMGENPTNLRNLINHEIVMLNTRRQISEANRMLAEMERRRPHVQAQQPPLRQRRLPRPDDSNNSSSQSHSRGGGGRVNRGRRPNR